jgi:hypothetical protein
MGQSGDCVASKRCACLPAFLPSGYPVFPADAVRLCGLDRVCEFASSFPSTFFVVHQIQAGPPFLQECLFVLLLLHIVDFMDVCDADARVMEGV